VSDTLTTLHRCLTEGAEIALRRRTSPCGGLHYEVVVNGTFLFSTYNRDSERTLARLAIYPVLTSSKALHVLIGGLGIGYTLQAILEYKEVHSVTIVEKEKIIVDWCKTYFGPYNGFSIEDPRVSVVDGDFLSFIRSTRITYDSVCLDLDNGPDWLVWEENRALYVEPGLKEIKNVMKPGGRLGIWSSSKANLFESKLSRVFKNSSVHTISTTEMGRYIEYYIYTATRQQ